MNDVLAVIVVAVVAIVFYGFIMATKSQIGTLLIVAIIVAGAFVLLSNPGDVAENCPANMAHETNIGVYGMIDSITPW